MLLILMMLCQDGYFLDGTEFTLKDGTVIKTLAPITYENDVASWDESGNFYVFNRAKIREIRYFSIYVPGPPPVKLYKTTRQKRIDADSIAFESGNVTKCRFLHVDAYGKTMAGRVAANFVHSVTVSKREGGNASEFEVSISKAAPQKLMVFSFYDFQGSPLVQKTVDLSQAKIKKGNTTVRFEIAGGIALEQCGLLEIYSFEPKP